MGRWGGHEAGKAQGRKCPLRLSDNCGEKNENEFSLYKCKEIFQENDDNLITKSASNTAKPF